MYFFSSKSILVCPILWAAQVHFFRTAFGHWRLFSRATPADPWGLSRREGPRQREFVQLVTSREWKCLQRVWVGSQPKSQRGFYEDTKKLSGCSSCGPPRGSQGLTYLVLHLAKELLAAGRGLRRTDKYLGRAGVE